MTGISRARGDAFEAVARAEATVRPVLEGQLRDAVESNATVAGELRAWNRTVRAAGETDAVDGAAARQANVLTNRVRYRVFVGRPPPDALRATPVTPFRGLDVPDAVDGALDDLETTLAELDGVGPSVLGARYEAALDDEERRTRGQFYTPAPVAAQVVRWALDVGVDRPRVLDPAAGTGTFQLTAYDVLRERNPGAEPGDLLSRLVAVDVDDVALHLAALRLSARTGGGSVETFDRRPRSFFEVEPVGDAARFDAVVGNPPFVRSGGLSPDRAHFREHLAAYGSRVGGTRDEKQRDGDGSPYLEGERALSRRSDASVYFVTHATRFLRPGGRLGMVLPAKWLESDYGVGFRRFLDDQYLIRAVVGFDERTFDALVDTVLLLAERRGGDVGCAERRGDGSPVRFVRLDGRSSVTESLGPLDDGDGAAREGATGAGSSGEAGTSEGAGTSRVVTQAQATFAEARQCSPYLRAPEALLPLLDHPAFVPLGDLASVTRGVTTGANRFFLLDESEAERWGIDRRFLRPALRSVRGVDVRTLSAEHVDRSILDVHAFLAERSVLDVGEGVPAERAKAALRRAGHGGLVDYVERAEAEGWHEGRTCQARRVWFDLGDLPTPDAFVPKLLRERVFTVRNRAGAVPSNAIDCLSVRDGVDPDVLLGVLDSSLCRALMEVWGRDEAGMLQLMTYETRSLPVPDVRTFSAREAGAVREAAAAVTAADDGPERDEQAALDAAVIDALDLDLSAVRIRRLREGLLARRVDGGARDATPVS